MAVSVLASIMIALAECLRGVPELSISPDQVRIGSGDQDSPGATAQLQLSVMSSTREGARMGEWVRSATVMIIAQSPIEYDAELAYRPGLDLLSGMLDALETDATLGLRPTPVKAMDLSANGTTFEDGVIGDSVVVEVNLTWRSRAGGM